jgi:serine/threonine protein kinase
VGTVFRAAGGDDRQRVAVKVFHAHLAADRAFRARLAQEVRAVSDVSRRRLVPVVDANMKGQVLWIARPYVPGAPLDRELARREILDLPELTWLAIGLADGLARLHEAGLVHRDLKPSNILLSRYGPRITDFGSSAAVGRRAFAGTDLASATARFMSPEQARGAEAGPASDIFSAAAVLVQAARGIGPFCAGDPATTWYRVASEAPDLDGVPQEMRSLLQWCLASDPARRPTARELRAALTYAELLPARPAPTARPARPARVTEQVDDRVPGVPTAPRTPVLPSVPRPVPPSLPPVPQSILVFVCMVLLMALSSLITAGLAAWAIVRPLVRRAARRGKRRSGY